jgi:hypothetical protein
VGAVPPDTSPTPPRSQSWLRLAGTTAGRVVLLVAIVAVVGVAVGLGVGYPISKIEVASDNAVELDQIPLPGTFDPEAALIAKSDLPDSWQVSDANFETFSMIGSPICGQAPEISNQLGTKLVRVYEDKANQGFILSEVVRVRRPADATGYVSEMSKSFEGCKAFFRVAGGEPTKVDVRPGQPNPPITDYVSRTLSPPKGGISQRVVFFAVGDVIVSIQYAGPTPPAPSLLDRAQKKILTRVAPNQFGKKRKVPGERTLPLEPTTTSTTTTTLPPTTLPPTTTTRVKRRTTTHRVTTTVPPAPPVTAAPGQ